MSRDSFDATWRALRRIVDVLDTNMATELTADAPAGLNVDAPASGAYYILPNARAVRESADINHTVMVCVYPSSERERMERTSGATTKSQPSHFEATIAVRVLEEAGAAAFADTWKTLTPKEREMRRCEVYLGAILDCMDSKIRDGDDIQQVFFVDSRSGSEEYTRTGTWGAVRYRIHQTITVPIQTS